MTSPRGSAGANTLTIVWLALIGGVVVYGTLVYLLLTLNVVVVGALDPSIMTIVGSVGLIGMAGGLVVRRRLIDSIPRGLDPQQALQRYTSAAIVGLAIIEGLGLMVITLALVSGAAVWALAGSLGAVGMMGLARPTQEEVPR